MKRSIADLTSPETAERIAASKTAIIPFGSIEQHGPHLPNGTDTFAAEVIADAVAEAMDAIVVPFGPYGVTPIHAGHPGTISLRRETFEALLLFSFNAIDLTVQVRNVCLCIGYFFFPAFFSDLSFLPLPPALFSSSVVFPLDL